MDWISFLPFTWEGKIIENLQFSLKVFKVVRKAKNKMVPIFLEENLGFREVIHLRKNQVISQQVGYERWPSHMSAVLWSCPNRTPALPIPIKSRPRQVLYQHTHRQDPQYHTWPMLAVSKPQAWKTSSRGGSWQWDYHWWSSLWRLPRNNCWWTVLTLYLHSLISPHLPAPI